MQPPDGRLHVDYDLHHGIGASREACSCHLLKVDRVTIPGVRRELVRRQSEDSLKEMPWNTLMSCHW